MHWYEQLTKILTFTCNLTEVELQCVGAVARERVCAVEDQEGPVSRNNSLKDDEAQKIETE